MDAEPDTERMDHYTRNAYLKIMGDIRDLVSLKNRIMIAETIEAAVQEVSSDMY